MTESVSFTSNDKKGLIVLAIIFLIFLFFVLGEIWVPTRLFYSDNETCFNIYEDSVLKSPMTSAGPGATAPAFFKTIYGNGKEHVGIQKFKSGDVLCIKIKHNNYERPLITKKGTNLFNAIMVYRDNPSILIYGLLCYLILAFVMLFNFFLILYRLYWPSIEKIKDVFQSKSIITGIINVWDILKELVLKSTFFGIIIGLVIISYKGFLIVERLPSFFIGFYIVFVFTIFVLQPPYSIDAIINMFQKESKNKLVKFIKEIVYFIASLFFLIKIYKFYFNLNNHSYESIADLIFEFIKFIFGI